MDEIFNGGTMSFHNWLRMCFVLNLTSNRYRLWVNDEKVDVKSNKKLDKFRSNGILFLGQDQDTHGGGFSADQSLTAEIADVLIFDYEISETRVQKFIQCQDIYNDQNFAPPIVHFRNISTHWIFNGSVVHGVKSSMEICRANNKEYVVFPKKQNFDYARYTCQITKGTNDIF